MRFLHHTDDTRQHCFSTYFLGTDNERSFLIDGSGQHMRANLLFYRNRLTAYHAFIYIRVTFSQKTIHGDLLAGADAHQIIDVQLVQRYIQFFTVAYYTGFLRL